MPVSTPLATTRWPADACTFQVTVGRPRSFDPDVVLDQAMAVFWKQGFEGTGMPDLEQATGLGRQSLYGAFGDKRTLFARVVEHYFARVLKPLRRKVRGRPMM